MTKCFPQTRRYIGEYIIGSTLGKGAFGKVKTARNDNTGDVVAIKIIDRCDYRQEVLESYKNEVCALKLLHGGKHIVNLYFYGYYEYPAKYITFRHIKAAVLGMEKARGNLLKK